MYGHKQVEIMHPRFRESFEVDEGIAPLILALWDKGIDTYMACQENQERNIWIEFASACDAEGFLTMVYQAAKDDKTYWRIRGDELPLEWEYSISLEDRGELDNRLCPIDWPNAFFSATYRDFS